MKKLKKILQALDGGRVLDVATRHGEFAVKLRDGLRSCTDVIAIDSSAAAVEEAQALALPGIRFQRMDGAHLDFADASFDLVAISNSLHHLERPAPVLAEMMRVLKPGGLFVINEMFCDSQSPARQTHVLLHHLGRAIDTLLGEYHGPTRTRDELTALFNGLGLADPLIFDDSETDPGLRAKLEKKVAGLDAKVKKTEGSPRYAEFAARAADVQARFARHGIERCTQLVLMGRKK